MSRVKNHPAVAPPRVPRSGARCYKGHRVLTLEETARRKPPLPPEPEWQDELRRLEDEQAAKRPVKSR
jgi:hypothetical protein